MGGCTTSKQNIGKNRSRYDSILNLGNESLIKHQSNKKELEPFQHQLDRLKCLENKIGENMKIKDSLINKDLCFICGQTGIGKSTFLNYLSGQKIIKVKDDKFKHFLTLENIQHQVAEIGNSYKSTTLHINQFQSTLKQESIYICDGPGLLDSKGFEGNVINSIITINTIYEASSIRFILMFTPDQYSMQGRAGYIKEVSKQYVQMFQQFEKYQDSIILAFNYIDKKDEEMKTAEAVESFEQVKESIINNSEKQFVGMLINKIKDKHYFLFDYTQNGQDVKEIKQKIHKLKPITNQQINQYIKYSIPQSSQSEFNDFLSKCIEALKYCIKNYHPVQASEIVSAFSNISQNIPWKDVKEQYRKAIEEIREQESIVERFQSLFSNFINIKLYDPVLSENVVEYMRLTLQFYFIVELIQYKTKSILSVKNTISDIARYIKKQIDEIYNISNQNPSLEVKYYQVLKLSYIIQNQKLKEDFEEIYTQLNEINVGFLPDVFNLSNYNLILKDLQQTCEKLSFDINEIINNQVITEDIKIILKSFQFLHENKNKENMVKIEISLDYQKIQLTIQKQIQQLAYQLSSLKEGQQKNNSIGKTLEKQYKFIKFICSSQNTDQHFQIPAIQNEFNELKIIIKGQLINLYLEGSRMKTLGEISNIQGKLQIFQSLDDEFLQEVKESNYQAFVDFENNLNLLFEALKKQFQSYFQQNFDQVNYFMQNQNIKLLPSQLFNDLKQNPINISKLIEIASQFLQNLQSNYRDYQTELNNQVAKIENEISENINMKEKLVENVKYIQVLMAIHTGFAECNISFQAYLVSIQMKQIEFIQAFSKWVRTIFKLHHVPSKLEFQELDKLNQSICNVKNYLIFLQYFKECLTSPIQVIYKRIIQRSKDIEEQPQQILPFIIDDADKNPNQKQNILAICDISFIRELDEEIDKANKYLKQFKSSFNKIFYGDYNFDLEKLFELPIKMNIAEIKNILDQLKQIFNESNNQITELYKINLYQNAQDIMVAYLQKKLQDIQLMNDDKKIEAKKKKIEELENYKAKINSHIPPNIDFDLDKQKLKIKADQQRLDEKLTALLLEDRFKEAYQQLEKEEGQKKIFQQCFAQRTEQIFNNLQDAIDQFQYEPSPQLQQTVLLNYRKLSEAYNSQQFYVEKSKVEEQLNIYTERLISKLFCYLDRNNVKIFQQAEQNKQFNSDYYLQFDKLKSITKIYFKKVEKQEVQQESLIPLFKNNILLKLKDIQKNLESNKQLQENIEILIQMHEMVEELEQKEILNSSQIKSQEKLLMQHFQNLLEEQTDEFIHSNYEFNPEKIELYMRDNFQKIWDFFQISNQEVQKLINNFINQKQKLINSISQSIKTQNPKKIIRAATQYKQSKLVHNSIRGQVQLISSNILIECIPHKNFSQAKKLLNNLEEIYQFFEKKQDPLKVNDEIQQIFQNITNEILSKWKQLEELSLKEPSKMHNTLQLIDKLSIMLTNCPLEQIQNKCNQLNLIKLIQNSFEVKLEEIKQSIDNLDHESTANHYSQLFYAFNQKIVFLKKNRNYIMIFEKLVRSYQLKKYYQDHIKAKYLIEQFSDLKKIFINLLENLQNNLLTQVKSSFLMKDFSGIIKQHLLYKEFCIQINGIENFVQDDKQLLILRHIEKQYQLLYQNAQNIEQSGKMNLEQLLQILSSLQDFEKNFQKYSKEIRTANYSSKINQIIEQQILIMIRQTKELIKQFDQEQIRKDFVQQIIKIYSCTQQLGISSTKYDLKALIQEATEGQEMDIVQNLLFHLNQDPIGCKLQEDNSDIFKQWFVQLYNSKTEKQNSFDFIKGRLQSVQGKDEPNFNGDELFAQYSFYKTKYDDTNLLISQLKIDKNCLTSSILQKAKRFKENGKYLTESKIVWSVEQKKALLEILAEVSAIWSIIDRQESNSKTSRFIHTIQIITIMRLIAVDQSNQSQVFNHIAQVRTGEGKSIALGITSTIFALIGFQVDCCCYSQYLSDRDFKDFESFFSNFKVDKQIQYNTFSKLTEKIVNCPNDLRTLGENYFSSNQQQIPSIEQNQAKKILIIDEIDFFFGENFLAEVYAVGCQLKSKQVVNLMKLIWNKRYRNITIETIKNTNEYTELFNKNPKLNSMRKFINSKIEKMLSESKQMEKHTYLLKRTQNSVVRKIGYQEIDRISYDIIKGYKTAFAYLSEWQRKKITAEQLEDNLALNFNLGCFSYPKIVENYSLVLGVTGTLQDMTDFQKRKMKELCNIEKQTITPSIFGESKFKFDQKQNVHIFSNKEEYFSAILGQAKEVIAQNRSVIIFFENQKVLFDFKKYSDNSGVSNYQILFEQTTDKKVVISQAAYSGMITLSTKPFGRGTDFKCFDNILLKNGGIHAIQTFLSDTLAEQKQIEGRVARNGEPGSYSLIVLQSDLEIKNNYIPQGKDPYDLLSSIRLKKMDGKDKELDIKQKECEFYHKKSILLKELLNSQRQQIDKINQLLEEIAVYGDSKDNKINKPSQFYNQFSEQEMLNAEKDKNNNPKNNKFDLGKDGQYKDKSILIGQFCDDKLMAQGVEYVKQSLNQKGFKESLVVTDEKQFVNVCSRFDQIWVISDQAFNCKEQGIQEAFVNSVLQHLKQRKGVMIFADNKPFYYHANLLLKKIPIGYQEQNPIYMDLQGNDIACNTLKRGVYDKQLQFGNHSITSGLNEIYEGNTICYPKILNEKDTDTYGDFLDIEIVGTSTTNRPCMFVLNGSNKRGRIVFDCGFTKLMKQYWTTAGTSRYVQNCYAWLYFMDKDEE